MEQSLNGNGGLSLIGFHNYINDMNMSKLSDFSGVIHPAFLTPGYAAALTPGVLRPTARNLANSSHHRSTTFTIDAILSTAPNGTDSQKLLENCHKTDVRTNRKERTQRVVHPYMVQTPQSTLNIKEKYTDVEHESCHESRQKKNKRVRTIFTPEQLERLEAQFERQQYMVGTERFYLASSLNLTEAQVKVWFQNRRIKWRKQNLEQQHKRLVNLGLLQPEVRDDSGTHSDSDADSDTVRIDTNSGEYVPVISCEQFPIDGAVDVKVSLC